MTVSSLTAPSLAIPTTAVTSRSPYFGVHGAPDVWLYHCHSFIVKNALQMNAPRRKCAMQLVRAQEHVSLQKEPVLLVTRVPPHQVCT